MLSISVSLIAVFIPILLMGGIVGRLFREFAVTLSVAILVSLVISLTTTPMMCALRNRTAEQRSERSLSPRLERAFKRPAGDIYGRHPHLIALASLGRLTMLSLLPSSIALNVCLFTHDPQGPHPPAGHRAHGRQASRPTRASPSS